MEQIFKSPRCVLLFLCSCHIIYHICLLFFFKCRVFRNFQSIKYIIHQKQSKLFFGHVFIYNDAALSLYYWTQFVTVVLTVLGGKSVH